MTRIVVIGASGDMGGAVVRQLLADAQGVHIVATGRSHPAGASAAGVSAGKSRLDVVQVDVHDARALRVVLRGAHAVVNCAGPAAALALPVFRVAVQTRTPYVDIADEVAPIRALLALRSTARGAGITAVTGIGWTPGLTNLLVRRGTELLSTPREAHVVWVGSCGDSRGPAVVDHVLQVAFGVTTQVVDGKTVRRRAGSGGERAQFPVPLGRVRVSFIAHPEPVMLAESLPDLVNVTVRGAVLPGVVRPLTTLLRPLRLPAHAARRAVVAALFARLLPVLSRAALRRAPACSGLVVEVKGERDARSACYRAAAVDTMARLTAIPCATVALLLARRIVRSPGVHSPESIVPWAPVAAALSAAGVTLEESCHGPITQEGVEIHEPARRAR